MVKAHFSVADLVATRNKDLEEDENAAEKAKRYKEWVDDEVKRRTQTLWKIKVNLYSTNRRLVEKLHDNFLRQYIKTGAEEKPLLPIQTLDQPPRSFYSSCIMETDQLASLVHFPTKGATCELLETVSMKAKLPPPTYTDNGIVLGQAEARGQSKTVTLPPNVRDRHLYVVGKSGTGKSTFLFNCSRQDIEAGQGVCVIDPHGDLVEDLLTHIPKERIEDTIYFNATDKEYPIALNVFNAQNEDEVALLVDDLLITFKRLSENWGDRMDAMLRFTFHVLLRLPEVTFLDILTLLQNETYRSRAISKINDRFITDYWEQTFTGYPKDAALPILNRMSKFVLSPTLRGILGQADSNLNFYDVLQNKKILLVNLSQGQIGEDTSKLLGSILVSQLQLAVMRRAALPKEQREPYFLYVDEFQNFTTSAFEKILSEARKYKLCLTLAHQYTSQLDDRTRNAILSNVGTMVMFQLGLQDANYLKAELGQFVPDDLTNLSSLNHETLCKPATQSSDTFKFTTFAPPARPESFAEAIIDYTRENYCSSPVQPQAPTPEEQPEEKATPSHEPRPPRRPARALPKEFATTKDKILHYVNQTEWLSNDQIIQLCYGHLAETSKKSQASRDLKQMFADKQIKFEMSGKEKIYFCGRSQQIFRAHDIGIRTLYTKIVASNYELAETSFVLSLGTLNPDLTISFLAEDGSLIKTFWEYDTGTEGIGELIKKADRYRAIIKASAEAPPQVAFIFDTWERLQQVTKTITDNFLTFAVLENFNTLDDPSFHRPVKEDGAKPFFET